MAELPESIARLDLGPDLRISEARAIANAGTNSVWSCRGTERGRSASWILKVADRSTRVLHNERAVLERLAGGSVPVPEVVRFVDGAPQALLLSEVEGTMLWDLVDPRRPRFEKSTVLANLRSLGACLARIHREPIAWPSEQRPRLYELIGEQDLDDRRFAPLVDWLNAHRPRERRESFVHGDFNVANVLFDRGRIAGVVDWEFAGTGWAEYEIAWALRARTHFLATEGERAAILEGYAAERSFDESQLRYCEVLNYVHFALWDLDADPDYAAFSLRRAADLAGR